MVEKRDVEREDKFNLTVDVLMLAGTLLLQSGSEIYRVEDTMIRIAHSQGIMDCNALAMPVAIFFSIENTNISRMKRITHSNYNIEKVCDVNQVSRELVSGDITLEEAFEKLAQLKKKKAPYTNKQLTLAATISAPFSPSCLVAISMMHSELLLRPFLAFLFLFWLINMCVFPLSQLLPVLLFLDCWHKSGHAILAFLQVLT